MNKKPRRDCPRWTGYAATMGLFAVMHVSNGNTTILSFSILMLVAFALAFAYDLTDAIWYGIGFHITWNILESFYGFPVSNIPLARLFSMKYPVNTVWNGGKYGPESGLFVLLVTIGMIVFQWKKFRSTGRN